MRDAHSFMNFKKDTAMKEVLKGLFLIEGLTWKQGMAAWWLLAAVCLMVITEHAPGWFYALEAANVAFAAMVTIGVLSGNGKR